MADYSLCRITPNHIKQWRSHGGTGAGGTRPPPTCPKDRSWDSSSSDEKLVRLREGSTTQCLWIVLQYCTLIHWWDFVMSVYVLMMFVGTEEAFPLQNTDLGLLKSVSKCCKMSSFLGWNSKKNWGRAPPQIPPPNGSDLNYFQFTLCHAEL